jgi:integrase
VKHGHGSIRKRHGSWQLRYYIDEIGPDVIGPEGKLQPGEPRRRQITKILARISDQYRTESSVQTLADDILVPLRRSGGAAEGSLTVAEFTDRYFLPFIKGRRKPSTAQFYKITFDLHVRGRVGHLRLREFKTHDAQKVLNAITLSQQSLLRIKTTMSAVFSHAIRLGFIDGVNPVRESKAEGTPTDPQLHAYTLDEIAYMLKKLAGRAKVAVGIAAFAGLRESEIRGLQWPDYDGSYLQVQRSVWRTHIGTTKTPESKQKVPVIEPLRKLLDQHKATANGNLWILTGEKKGFSLNLDNLCSRDIRPVIGERWHGWHAFRRGLATNLFNLGVPAEVVKIILRHSDVATTQKHYVVLQSQQAGRAAMQTLEKALADKGQSRASKTTPKRKQPHKH